MDIQVTVNYENSFVFDKGKSAVQSLKNGAFVIKKICIFILPGILSLVFLRTECVFAFEVPYYSYIESYSSRGHVSQDGVATPGPRGEYSSGEDEGPASTFLAHGYRWWAFIVEGTCFSCLYPPSSFNFPGDHPVIGTPCSPCISQYTGSMAGWGGVIADPEASTITLLAGASNSGAGPTSKYCVPLGGGQICYPIPSTWGYEQAYGYIRKVVKVDSDGTLQPGDPVDIHVSISVDEEFVGDPGSNGSVVVNPVVFLTNNNEDFEWHQWRNNGYLKWGDVKDILGSSPWLDKMIGYISSTSGTITAQVTVGDIIVMETIFRIAVSLDNPDMPDPTQDNFEVWAASQPPKHDHTDWGTTQHVKSLVEQHGNTLQSFLTSNTLGALLVPYTVSEQTKAMPWLMLLLGE